MCRFTVYLGPKIRIGMLVTEPKNSLIHQSYESHERRHTLNGDGFGIGWYAAALSAEPALFKSIGRAGSPCRHAPRATRRGDQLGGPGAIPPPTSPGLWLPTRPPHHDPPSSR